MKDYDKNQESSYLKYGDPKHLYEWVMPQRLPTDIFERVEGTSQFNKDFMKNSYNKDSHEEYFLEYFRGELRKFQNDLGLLPE